MKARSKQYSDAACEKSTPAFRKRYETDNAQQRPFRTSRGVSLLEYGMIGILVFALCAGTTFIVGNQMKQLLGELKQNMRHRVESARGEKPSLPGENVLKNNTESLLPSPSRKDDSN